MDRTIGSQLDPAQMDRLAINTIRFLAVDAVQKAYQARSRLIRR